MNGSASKALFWWAIIAQVAGAQLFFWDALPDYQELTEGAVVVGTPKDFAIAVFGLVVMQSAYWYARRLQPQIRFRHRVVLGHVLLCVSEVSFFFVSALATVAMFDHLEAIAIRLLEIDAAGFCPFRLFLLQKSARKCWGRSAGDTTRGCGEKNDRTERNRQTMKTTGGESFAFSKVGKLPPAALMPCVSRRN